MITETIHRRAVLPAEGRANTLGQPYISFCTTCANRLTQFSRTFDANASQVESMPDVEWVILDFGSKDAIAAYMADRLPVRSRRIKYVREFSGRPWHSSIAKNLAHRFGSGQFLFNLDCDNFIDDATEMLCAFFGQGGRIAHLWSGVHGDGTYGRIGIERALFYELGGYDEDLLPMGYQDTDLLQRAAALGVPLLQGWAASRAAIRNSKELSVKHCATEGMAWVEFNKENMLRSERNISAGVLRANAGGWPEPDVEIHAGGVE